MLHGRDVERARLAALLDRARHGHAAALVVHGEPGIGKSALLEDLIGGAGADGFRVLRTQGLQAESPLAFGALYRLLRPALPLVERLAAPQARALRIAFGQLDGTAADPFLVGVATLSMLSGAAEETPVLCVVDDAHWLDTASADALLFAARRLDADQVVVVFAARDDGTGTFTPDGIESMPLGGLDPAAVRSLLADQAGGGLAEEVAQRLLVETGGNPLALVELPAGLSAAQLRGTAPLPTPLLMGAGVERVFLDRIRRLSPQVQTLMLVAAADDTGQPATIRLAAGSLGVGTPAWTEAEQSGLLLVDAETLRVRHPLVRSAVYQAATSLERRRAHEALAEALRTAGDSDREAWHRAAAADGWDEDLAADLERIGVRAERRGGYLAAAAAFERAADLTAAEQSRASRLFAAARNAWASGQSARARSLAATARDQADNLLLRADIDRLRGRIEVNVGSATAAHRIFMQAARAVADVDPVRALEMAVAAAVMHNYGVDSGASIDTRAIPVDVQPNDSARVRCLKQLLVAMTMASREDWEPAVAALNEAVGTGRDVVDVDLLGNLGNAALNLGDDQAARHYYTVMLSSSRESGAGMAVVYALQRLAFTQLLAGRWTDLRASAEEALTLSHSVGQRALAATPLAWLTLLAALQGRADYDQLRSDLADVVGSHPLGILTDPIHDLTQWAMGIRAGHAGQPGAAVHHLGRLRLPTLIRMAAPDRIEAASRAGDPGRAVAWVEDLTPFATATEWPWALGNVDYGRALTADPADAVEFFENSLAHHRRRPIGSSGRRPYDEARVQLAYGEFLRRTQRRVEARTHLRSALETFTDLSAAPLVARASQELRASGESARKRDPSTLLELTPMELQVAQLVSGGLSNKEVAAQCWISPRTVAFHLRNVFSKTGVTSRGELAQLPLR